MPLAYLALRTKYDAHIKAFPASHRQYIDQMDTRVNSRINEINRKKDFNHEDIDSPDEFRGAIDALGMMLAIPKERKLLYHADAKRREAQEGTIQSVIDHWDSSTRKAIGTFVDRATIVSFQSPESRKEENFQLPRPILQLYGPPGVGKTTTAKAIARGLGYQDHQIILMSLDDLQVLAMGNASQSPKFKEICAAGINNVFFIIDEADKQSKNTSSGYFAWGSEDNDVHLLNFTHPSDGFRTGRPSILLDFSGAPTILTRNERSKSEPLNDRAPAIYIGKLEKSAREKVAKQYYEKVLGSMDALKYLDRRSPSAAHEVRKTSEKLLPYVVEKDHECNDGMRALESAVTNMVGRLCLHYLNGGKANGVNEEQLKADIEIWVRAGKDGVRSNDEKNYSAELIDETRLNEAAEELARTQKELTTVKSALEKMQAKVRRLKDRFGVSSSSSDYGSDISWASASSSLPAAPSSPTTADAHWRPLSKSAPSHPVLQEGSVSRRSNASNASPSKVEPPKRRSEKSGGNAGKQRPSQHRGMKSLLVPSDVSPLLQATPPSHSRKVRSELSPESSRKVVVIKSTTPSDSTQGQKGKIKDQRNSSGR